MVYKGDSAAGQGAPSSRTRPSRRTSSTRPTSSRKRPSRSRRSRTPARPAPRRAAATSRPPGLVAGSVGPGSPRGWSRPLSFGGALGGPSACPALGPGRAQARHTAGAPASGAPRAGRPFPPADPARRSMEGPLGRPGPSRPAEDARGRGGGPQTRRAGRQVVSCGPALKSRTARCYLPAASLRMPSVTMPTLVTPAPLAASMMRMISP